METIAVSGNNRYTQEEIITASGVQIGDNLFRMNKGEIAQRIRESLPMWARPPCSEGCPAL